MTARRPRIEDIRALKARHGLTYAAMAAPLYGVPVRTMENWASGHRDMPTLAWWALVLHFDGVDLREVDACPLNPTCGENINNGCHMAAGCEAGL